MTHENFWKLMGTVRKLKNKENKCFVCGSTEDIVPHHIRKVKQEIEDYYSEDNLVLLCDECHHRYHRQYPDVNSKTFCEFMRKNLRNPPKQYKTDFKITDKLKTSKLKKILKSVNKTSKKVVKVSFNGKVYDVSRIWDDGEATILEATIR